MGEDLLLTWMSECGSGSWTQFREAHDWLLNADRMDADRIPAQRTVHTLAVLGHVDVDWQNGLWAAAPPVLTMLPSAGAHALLTGGRTRTLVDRLTEESSDERTMNLFVEEHEQWDAPRAIFIASRDELEIESLAMRLGISYTYSVSESLSTLLPSLEVVLALARSTPGVAKFGVQRFNPAGLAWKDTFSDGGPGLYQYSSYGKPQYRHVTADGRIHDVDRATGIYAELSRVGQRVLRYEHEELNGTLIVPSAAPLPVLHARSAALCSGLAPVLIRTERVKRYVNVPSHLARRIAVSLGQEPIDSLELARA